MNLIDEQQPVFDESVDHELLLVAAQRGDQQAFGELCTQHQTMMVRVAYRITSNMEDAQDALQNALLSAYRALPEFNRESTFRTWLTRIVMNAALMIVRKRQGSGKRRRCLHS